MIGAKAQPSNTLLPVLRQRKTFEVRLGAWVRRIVHRNGRVTGVMYTDKKGADFVQPATTVVLASWTLNNVRLLFLSRIGTPYDPASKQGTLGKNLTHQVARRTPVFLDQPLNAFMGSGALGTWVSMSMVTAGSPDRKASCASARSWCSQPVTALSPPSAGCHWARRHPPGDPSGRRRAQMVRSQCVRSSSRERTSRGARISWTWIRCIPTSSAIPCCVLRSTGRTTNMAMGDRERSLQEDRACDGRCDR